MAGPNVANIPQDLRERHQWVLWKTITRAGKPTKVPYRPNGIEADSSDPATWTSYKEVDETYHKGGYDGIGYVFDPLDPYAGIDLDDCVNPDGSIKPKAKMICDSINSYSEISPSGKGIKIFLKAKIPIKIPKKDGKFQQGFNSKKPDLEIEIYYGTRFFTLTGNRLADYPPTIEDRNSVLTALFRGLFKDRGYFGEEVHPSEPTPEKENVHTTISPDAGKRFAELLKTDPRFAENFTGPAPVGKRSDVEFNLCARLWEAGIDEADIYIIMTSSPHTKWAERDDNYRWETIKKAVAKSETSHKEITGPTPEQIIERIKENRDALKDPVILAAMAALKKTDTIEYDLLVDDIKGAIKGVRIAAIRARVDVFIAEQQKANTEYTIPPGVLVEANRILDEGKGFEFAYHVWQKRHHGDENLGKGLFLSLGAQSCISAKGVHIHACGPRGSGKSDGAEKASEAIPTNHLLIGSASPKALYYLGEQLPAGAVVYLDDIGWNDQAAQMFKTCTTFYKDGATHTVVVDQEIMQFKTAPRIIFWLTTADDQTDEQIRDRLLRIDTTETATHTKEVIDFIFQQRKSGTASFDSGELEVCQAIIYLLKQVFIDVVIPFSDSIRFEGDPRGATIFADLVSSFAIWRHRIRARNSNGAVVASYDDYKDAETFFNAIRGHGDTKYTPGELRVLQAIKDLHGEATREMLIEKTGISKGGLADIFNGRSRDGQAKYGLLHKCPTLTEEDESTQKRVDDDTRQTKRRKIYRLPQDYDVLTAYGKAVYLDDETTIKRTCSVGSDKFAESSQVKNEFGKDIVRKFVVNKNIREREANSSSSSSVDVVKSENISLSQKEPKIGELANLLPKDSDLPPRTDVRTDANPERTAPNDDVSNIANSDMIKSAAISEYGMCGWVDPAKIAAKLKLPLSEVVVWLQANYAPFERHGGGIGYTQRRSGEAST